MMLHVFEDYKDDFYAEGFVIGFKKSFKEGFKEDFLGSTYIMAIRLMEEGISDDIIQKHTELSIEEVVALRKVFRCLN